MDKPTSQKWRSFTPARSGKMVHYCSGDWRSFAPALTTSAPNSPAKSSELHQTSRFMTFKQPTAGSRSRSLIGPNQAVDRAAEYMFINLFKKVLWHVGD
jgi:hypothetical protein